MQLIFLIKRTMTSDIDTMFVKKRTHSVRQHDGLKKTKKKQRQNMNCIYDACAGPAKCSDGV